MLKMTKFTRLLLFKIELIINHKPMTSNTKCRGGVLKHLSSMDLPTKCENSNYHYKATKYSRNRLILKTERFDNIDSAVIIRSASKAVQNCNDGFAYTADDDS